MRALPLLVLAAAVGLGGCAYDLDAFSAAGADAAGAEAAGADAAGADAADAAVADAVGDTLVGDAIPDALQGDDPTGVDVAACKLAPGYAACIQCCVDRLPGGAKKTWQQAGDCFCNGSHCKASCAAPCAARAYGGADASCLTCLGDALVGSCGKSLTAGKQLRNCVAACPGASGD